MLAAFSTRNDILMSERPKMSTSKVKRNQKTINGVGVVSFTSKQQPLIIVVFHHFPTITVVVLHHFSTIIIVSDQDYRYHIQSESSQFF